MMIKYPDSKVEAMVSWKESPYRLKNVLDQKEINYLIEMQKQCEKVKKNSGIINYKFKKGGELEKFMTLKVSDKLGEVFRHGGSYVETPEPFHAHTDTGKIEEMGESLAPYKNILIPLINSNESIPLWTVFFRQRHYGPAVHLWRGESFKNKNPVYNFKMTDYSSLENYSGKDFSKVDYEKYLSHLPMDSLFGLTIEKKIEWKIGDIIIFDCSQVHASNNFKNKTIKKSLTMFVSRRIK